MGYNLSTEKNTTMGIFHKLFSQSQKIKNDIEASAQSANTANLNHNGEVFSDNSPDLMKVIKTSIAAKPDKSLPFSKVCPNCGVVFDKPIKRKKTCSSCGKTIYVRTTQDLYKSSALTEEQVNHADFYLALKNTIYVTMDDYKKMEDVLKKKWNKKTINTYDVLWSLFNNLNFYQRYIDKSYSKEDVMIEILRRKQALGIEAAAYQAQRGHNPIPFLESAQKNTVQAAKLSDYAKGLTVESFNCCNACMKFHEKTFSLDFLQKTPVLPIKTCTRPFDEGSKFTFCICFYQEYYNFE